MNNFTCKTSQMLCLLQQMAHGQPLFHHWQGGGVAEGGLVYSLIEITSALGSGGERKGLRRIMSDLNRIPGDLAAGDKKPDHEHG